VCWCGCCKQTTGINVHNLKPYVPSYAVGGTLCCAPNHPCQLPSAPRVCQSQALSALLLFCVCWLMLHVTMLHPCKVQGTWGRQEVHVAPPAHVTHSDFFSLGAPKP
jgi:hypothetical protein